MYMMGWHRWRFFGLWVCMTTEFMHGCSGLHSRWALLLRNRPWESENHRLLFTCSVLPLLTGFFDVLNIGRGVGAAIGRSTFDELCERPNEAGSGLRRVRSCYRNTQENHHDCLLAFVVFSLFYILGITQRIVFQMSCDVNNN